MTIGVEQLLENIATCLEAPRNRFGKIEVTLGPAQDYIRKLAVQYQIGSAQDVPDQIAKVIRAILKEQG